MEIQVMMAEYAGVVFQVTVATIALVLTCGLNFWFIIKTNGERDKT